jgi:hypothetical protein
VSPGEYLTSFSSSEICWTWVPSAIPCLAFFPVVSQSHLHGIVCHRYLARLFLISFLSSKADTPSLVFGDYPPHHHIHSIVYLDWRRLFLVFLLLFGERQCVREEKYCAALASLIQDSHLLSSTSIFSTSSQTATAAAFHLFSTRVYMLSAFARAIDRSILISSPHPHHTYTLL